MRVYEKLTIYLLYWTVLQDFVLSLFLNFTNSIILTNILFYSKDVIFVVLILWGGFRVKDFKLIHWIYLLLYFLFIFIATVKSLILPSNLSLTSILSSIRGWLLLPGFIVIGLGVRDKSFFKKRLQDFLIKFLFIVSIIGIIEFLIDSFIVSTVPFWTNIVGIGNFMDVIKGQAGRLVEGLPGNFYGQYGGEFFSQKRLVSIWGGPLTAAYVLAIPCIYCCIKHIENTSQYQYFIKAIIFFIAILLTYTRAIILVLIIIIPILYFIKLRKIRVYLLILIPVILIILLLNLPSLQMYIIDGSTIGHITQVIDSLSNLTFGGSGLATFGVGTAIGTESAFITSLGQLGICGGLLYVFFNLYIVFKSYTLYYKTKQINYLGCCLIGITMFISGFISEQLLAFTSIAPYYILMGFSLSQQKQVFIKFEIEKHEKNIIFVGNKS